MPISSALACKGIYGCLYRFKECRSALKPPRAQKKPPKEEEPPQLRKKITAKKNLTGL